MMVDKTWIKKRIAGQFEYVIDIHRSDRTEERKKELIESAMGVVHNLMLEFPIDMDILIFMSYMVSSTVAQIRIPKLNMAEK